MRRKLPFPELPDAIWKITVRLLASWALLHLAACASAPVIPDDPDWARHRQEIADVSVWQLSGRLNVRQNGQSETVQINWDQQNDNFALRLSSSVLGLGAVYIHGTPSLITVERSGEETRVLPGFAALNREYFGYDFPTAQLLYWIRGIPAPGDISSMTLNDNLMLETLEQIDSDGRRWHLTYDRYQQSGNVFLPGRIRVSHDELTLTFLISRWTLPEPVAGTIASTAAWTE